MTCTHEVLTGPPPEALHVSFVAASTLILRFLTAGCLEVGKGPVM